MVGSTSADSPSAWRCGRAFASPDMLQLPGDLWAFETRRQVKNFQCYDAAFRDNFAGPFF
jgi:hypothetical protein